VACSSRACWRDCDQVSSVLNATNLFPARECMPDNATRFHPFLRIQKGPQVNQTIDRARERERRKNEPTREGRDLHLTFRLVAPVAQAGCSQCVQMRQPMIELVLRPIKSAASGHGTQLAGMSVVKVRGPHKRRPRKGTLLCCSLSISGQILRLRRTPYPAISFPMERKPLTPDVLLKRPDILDAHDRSERILNSLADA